jgi:hypothetical protein
MGMGWKSMVEAEIGAAYGTMAAVEKKLAAVEIGVVDVRNGAERAVTYRTKNGVVLVHGICKYFMLATFWMTKTLYVMVAI